MRRGYAELFTKITSTSLVQDEMWKLMRRDEQELLSLWEGWLWDDNKGGWLDRELCAKARREEVEHTSSPQDVHESPQRGVPTRDGQGTHQDRTGGDRQGATREVQRAREVRREGVQDALEARAARTNAATRGAESCVGDRHAHAWRKGCGPEGRTSTLQHEGECSSNCRQKITSQATSTCAGCCNTTCTARATPHLIGRKSLHRHSAISS